MSYAPTQTSAARMIADKGQAVTLTPPSNGTYDTATSTVGAGSGSPVTTTGVVLPLSRGLMHMAGTDIQAGDQRLLIPGNVDQPSIDTKATIAGVDYTIKEVSPLNPGGTALLFDCVIRR
jgi:hypothetical protein